MAIARQALSLSINSIATLSFTSTHLNTYQRERDPNPSFRLIATCHLITIWKVTCFCDSTFIAFLGKVGPNGNYYYPHGHTTQFNMNLQRADKTFQILYTSPDHRYRKMGPRPERPLLRPLPCNVSRTLSSRTLDSTMKLKRRSRTTSVEVVPRTRTVVCNPEKFPKTILSKSTFGCTKPKRMRRRTVSFVTDENNEMVTESFESNAFLTKRDIKVLWWTEEEAALTKERIFGVINAYKLRDDYVREFLETFSLCANCQSDAEEHVPKEKALRLNYTAPRGLESHILAILERYRSQYVAAVLLVQGKLALRDDYSSQERERVLASRAIQLSQTGRILARVIAAADSCAIA
jgi:hypothetical protein